MSRVLKSSISKKTNKELEKYILPNSRYVSKAIEYAVQILKKRGRVFSQEELDRIELNIQVRKRHEQIYVHPMFNKASILLYVSAALGLFNFIVLFQNFDSVYEILIQTIVLGLSFFLAYLVSRGYDWIKYPLILITFVWLVVVYITPNSIHRDYIVDVINVARCVLRVAAILILFGVPTRRF